MNYLHPWAIGLGAAAIALPLVIHWLTKPRPLRLPLSTVRFVIEAVRQRRARHRLRDLIVLLLRVAAVALLGWAFARPLLVGKPLVAADASGETTRIVVLDQSQSMAAVTRGVAAFDRAKPVAARYLSGGPGARGNLLLAAARPRATFDRVSGNFAAMREELSTAKPLGERLNLQAAINSAAEMLAARGEAGRNSELVIVSDLQRSDWASVNFAALPKQTRIQLESVAQRPAPPNVAITAVTIGGRVQRGREVPLAVEVGNYSTASRQIQAQVSVGGGIYQVSGTCAPGAKTTLTTALVPQAAGWQPGEAKLIGVEDALPADDVRSFVLNVRPTPTYVLVTREPSRPRASSSHFLERALAPSVPREGKPGERVQRVDPRSLDKDAIAAADLIIVDHPGKLSADSINLLAGLMRRGRAVLYVAAESVDAGNLKLLADAAGTDLRMPVTFLPPPEGQPRRNLFLAEVSKDQEPFREFGEGLPAAIGSLRFGGGLNTERAPGGLADDVQASFSDRSAFLVTTACGAGVFSVLNADLGVSNLPASSVFVPLVGELVGRLLGHNVSEAAVPSGEPLAAYLPVEAGAAAGLKINGPADDLGSFSDETNFVLWRWSAAGPPGIYEVKRDANTVYALAAAIPASEADLTPIDSTLLTGRLSGEREVSWQSSASRPEQKDNAWAWALVACTGCLLMEVAALKAFRT